MLYAVDFYHRHELSILRLQFGIGVNIVAHHFGPGICGCCQHHRERIVAQVASLAFIKIDARHGRNASSSSS